MNIYEEKSREFLKFQKILRELRLLRFSYGNTKNGQVINNVIEDLEPMMQELEDWLNANSKKDISDYDL